MTYDSRGKARPAKEREMRRLLVESSESDAQTTARRALEELDEKDRTRDRRMQELAAQIALLEAEKERLRRLNAGEAIRRSSAPSSHAAQQQKFARDRIWSHRDPRVRRGEVEDYP